MMEDKLRVVASNRSDKAKASSERMQEESKQNHMDGTAGGQIDDTEIDSILDMCDDF